MNATASPTQPSSAGPAPQPDDFVPVETFARRFPVLWLFASAAVWLIIASAFGLIDSLKFHDPNLLAGSPEMTYGRVFAAASASLLYGFGAQAAFALVIWLFGRMGRAAVVGPVIILLGVILWNAVVTAGICAILLGGATGLTYFQMPGYCDALLFVAYALIGLCAFLTFAERRPNLLYPSFWFAVGALLWFPWIFSTAGLSLLAMPVRGVMQPLIAWWYARNFDTIFLGFAGLASIFYFIPKLTGKPLYSYYLALMAFWLLALFGSCGGVPDGAPLPSWIPSLSVICTVLMIIPFFAIAANLFQTVRQSGEIADQPATRFTYVAMAFWIIATAQQIASVCPQISAVTGLTWFGVAQKQLFHYGFFAMAAMGAAYYIVPHLLGDENVEWCPKLAAANFWLMLVGVFVSYVSFLVAGIGEGILLCDPATTDLQIMKTTLIPLRASTAGDLLIFAGTVVFFANFIMVVSRRCYACLGKGGKV